MNARFASILWFMRTTGASLGWIMWYITYIYHQKHFIVWFFKQFMYWGFKVCVWVAQTWPFFHKLQILALYNNLGKIGLCKCYIRIFDQIANLERSFHFFRGPCISLCITYICLRKNHYVFMKYYYIPWSLPLDWK